jgi:hypothetical protein
MALNVTKLFRQVIKKCISHGNREEKVRMP